MRYVDGFLIPVPKKKLRAYQRIAQKAGRVWMKHGALQYCETVGDDLRIPKVASFPKTVRTKPGETVVFSWIVYRSKAHRDQVNKKVMKDPALAKMMTGENSPFDMKRMNYGGFRTLVDM